MRRFRVWVAVVIKIVADIFGTHVVIITLFGSLTNEASGTSVTSKSLVWRKVSAFYGSRTRGRDGNKVGSHESMEITRAVSVTGAGFAARAVCSTVGRTFLTTIGWRVTHEDFTDSLAADTVTSPSRPGVLTISDSTIRAFSCVSCRKIKAFIVSKTDSWGDRTSSGEDSGRGEALGGITFCSIPSTPLSNLTIASGTTRPGCGRGF